MLAADPEAGLTAFLQMKPPLNPSLVLSILRMHSRTYCAMYLEAALQMGVALPQVWAGLHMVTSAHGRTVACCRTLAYMYAARPDFASPVSLMGLM